jgi:tight adherence protein B
MLAALITAFLLITDGPWWIGVVIGVWMASPTAGLLIVVGGVAVSLARHVKDSPKTGLLGCVDVMAAELRSGQSLRHAVATGARASRVTGWEQVEARSLAGLPIADVGAGFTDNGTDGVRLRAVLAIADSTGGEAGVVFDALADTMRRRESLDRERRMATAQARFSAGVIAGGPLVVLLWLMMTGALGRMLSGGGLGAVIVVLGTVLEVVGVGVVVWMIYREESR